MPGLKRRQGILSPLMFFETLGSARHAKCFARLLIKNKEDSIKLECLFGEGPSPQRMTARYLVLFFARFLAATLSCQRLFHAFLLARLQVKGVTFHFLNDVFLLHLAFETAQRVLEGLALLKSDFSQSNYTPLLALNGPFCYDNLSVPKSSRMCRHPPPHFQNRNRSPNCTSRGAYALVAFMKFVGR